MRKLASIRRVASISGIPGADFIELAHVDGWQCVIKKGELKEGDLCVYFEIDSVLPSSDERFAFMLPRKYRVRTIKLRGQISQGLALPLSLFPEVVAEEGLDVTSLLGVKKHDPQEALERAYKRVPRKELWYYKLPFGRLIGRLLDPFRGKQFPPFIPKTDETRVQNIGNIAAHLHFPRTIYSTEKLDGMSVSIFYKKEPWYRKDIKGIASRNVWRHQVGGAWWEAGGPVLRKLEEYCMSTGRSLALQGEIVGPGIQGNRYELPNLRVFFFNVFDIDKQEYLPLEAKMAILLRLREPHVPFLGVKLFNADMDSKKWVQRAEGGSSLLPGVEREGIVVRSLERDECSFKAISNKYLLEEE